MLGMRDDGFVRQKEKGIHSYVKAGSAWLKNCMEQGGERMKTNNDERKEAEEVA